MKSLSEHLDEARPVRNIFDELRETLLNNFEEHLPQQEKIWYLFLLNKNLPEDCLYDNYLLSTKFKLHVFNIIGQKTTHIHKGNSKINHVMKKSGVEPSHQTINGEFIKVFILPLLDNKGDEIQPVIDYEKMRFALLKNYGITK